VALDIADAFRGAGAQVIIARTLKHAIEEATTADLTAAVIDHAMHDGVTTSDVCAALTTRRAGLLCRCLVRSASMALAA